MPRQTIPQDVELAAGGRLQYWLASNIITPEALTAAKNDDYNKFITLRAQAIDEADMKEANWLLDKQVSAAS